MVDSEDRVDKPENFDDQIMQDAKSNLDEVMDKPCKVDKVFISGVKRTKDYILQRELESLKQAQTLQEVHDCLSEAHDRLMALEIFDAVQMTIDESPKVELSCTTTTTGQFSISFDKHSLQALDRCTIKIDVFEANIFRFHAGTYVQGAEGTVEGSLNLRNPIGHGEQMALTIEHGTQHTNVYTLSYTLPKPWGLPTVADLRLHQLYSDKERWSSYVERMRGGTATMSTNDGSHSLSYEFGWQRLTNPSLTASRSIAAQLGDRMKSALTYTFAVNEFDNPVFPRSGWGLRASTEVAGLGPQQSDIFLRFIKPQIFTQLAFPVGDTAALHLEGAAGMLLPWGGSRRSSSPSYHSLSDRFYVGGIGNYGLRGFHFRGVGPTDARRPRSPSTSASDEGALDTNVDSLGGNFFCSALAALRFDLPFGEGFKAVGLRGQVFWNCGNVSQLSTLASRRDDAWDNFLKTFRFSIGAGIVWPTAFGKLEVNVCQILKANEMDQIKNGFQFGITPM